ncbi:hypothetical protein ABT010_12410 [Streptomyces sp. NPDC002668]|uniref:DUF7489 domain-containing protein n=1 Tax=Streptomyces sp. NPDC002668 TaxID=3154422 RepID=UPI003321F5C3
MYPGRPAALPSELWGVVGQVSRKAESAYAGEVVGLSTRDVTLTSGMRHEHLLTIRADDGQEITMEVVSWVYSSFAVGDRIVKQAGARWPRKAA